MKPGLRHEITDLIHKVLRDHFSAVEAAAASTGTPQPKRTEDKASGGHREGASPRDPTGNIKKRKSYRALKRWRRRALNLFSPAAVGFIASLMTFYPKITVQAGTPLDPRDPFTAPFEITSDGPIPIRSVSFSCILEDATTREQIDFKYGRILNSTNTVTWMHWGDSETIFCHSPISGLHPDYARIFITAEYNPGGMTTLHRWKFSKFETVEESNGSLRWIKRPPFFSNTRMPSELDIRNRTKSGRRELP